MDSMANQTKIMNNCEPPNHPEQIEYETIRRFKCASLLVSILTLAVSTPALSQELPTTTLGTIGTTDLQILTGDFIQTVCGGFLQNGGAAGIDQTAGNAAQQAELFDKCGEMVQTANGLTGVDGPAGNSLGITLEQLNSAVQNVAAEEAAAVGSNATELATNQTRNIRKRISGVLSQKGGFPLSVANLTRGGIVMANQLQADLAADEGGLLSNRLSYFANGIVGNAEKDETAAEDGFDANSSGVTFGADYRVSSKTVVGVAFGYDQATSNFTTSANVAGGGLDLNSTSVSVYGLLFSDNWYADAIVTTGTSTYDLERRLVVLATDDAVAAGNDGANALVTSSTDSLQLVASISGGFEFVFGANTLAPYARLSSSTVEVDGYDEQGGGGLNLRVKDQTIDSLNTALGIRAARAISTSFGVLVPQVTVEYFHEFKDDSREITSLYINDPRQNELILSTDAPDRDYFTAGLAMSAVLKNGWQFFGDVKTVLELDTISGSIVTVGIRKELY